MCVIDCEKSWATVNAGIAFTGKGVSDSFWLFRQKYQYIFWNLTGQYFQACKNSNCLFQSRKNIDGELVRFLNRLMESMLNTDDSSHLLWSIFPRPTRLSTHYYSMKLLYFPGHKAGKFKTDFITNKTCWESKCSVSTIKIDNTLNLH